MKKTYLASVVAATVLMVAGVASAADSTGCGLGSMAWRGHRGIGPQVLAVTTNSMFSQTIGITFGTSGCDPDGRISGGTQKMVLAFLENNMEQFAMDAAAGKGETLDTLAGLINMDKETVANKTRQNFGVIFANADVDAVDVTLKFFEVMKA